MPPEQQDRRHHEEEDLEPLIPSNILDLASQRVFVVSFFILIQSWKVYEVLLLKSDVPISGGSLAPSNNFTFVLKYAIIDGLFLWILPILSIPYLRFSPLKTLILTLVLNSVTFFLASSQTVVLVTSFVMPVWKAIASKRELTVVGDSVNYNRVVDMESHFKGKLTIHYLPDSSAKFNPFHFDKICLERSENQPLEMPIEFNTTTQLGFLQLQHITPDNNVNYLNYTANTLKKLGRKDHSHLGRYPDYKNDDSRIFYLEIPLKEPGLYRISKVTDIKNINIRTYKSEFMISHCPSSKFSYPPSFDESKNYKCLSKTGNEEPLQLPLLSVFGVTPVTVKFNVNLNGKHYKTINSSVGEVTTKPLLQSKRDVSWIDSHSLTRNTLEQEILHYPEIMNDAKEGTLEFQLVEIIDHLGNSKRYNPASSDKDVRFDFELKSVPSFGITDYDSSTELLINGTKTIQIVANQNLKDSEFPITVDISYTNKEDELLSHTISKTFKSLTDLKQGIIVDKAGSYRLISTKNRFCSCEISKSNEVSFSQAFPPEVGINAEPIVDKCLGTTGYTFDLSLVGRAPFQVQYTVYKKQENGALRPVQSERGTVARVLRTSDNHHTFKFTPTAEGNYVIKFKELRDANYISTAVKLDEDKYTYLTYFNQISKVSFFENAGRYIETKNICSGESLEIPLYFTGNGPFEFDVDFVDPQTNKKLISSVKVKDAMKYLIKSPKQLIGKNYKIKVSNIKDKFTCDALIDERESITVKSRSDIPEAQIQVSSEVKIVEGEYANIPLDIKSSIGRTSSDKLEYKVANLYDSSKITTRSLIGSLNLKVKEEGIYTLVSYENSGCPGVITNKERSVLVTYYNKPNLTVSSENVMKQHTDDSFIHLNPLCQNCESLLKLQLEGASPFVVDYEIKFPNGRSESKSLEINKNDVTIKLPTSHSGRYEYRFVGVYDNLYTKKTYRKGKKELPNVMYEINPLPNAKFESSEQFSQVCETALNKKKGPIVSVPMTLKGKYPYQLKASLTHEETGKTKQIHINALQEAKIHLESEYFVGLGEHILTINELTDANGCTRKDFSTLNSYVIVVTEVPSVAKKGPKVNFCVGDHVEYNLTGIPPFTVFYKFNDNARKAELSFNFKRLASKPGALVIDGLQDSSTSKCYVDLSQSPEAQDELSVYIHDLPSVEINKGDYIVEDIHEGDQTELYFTFIGTPPFTLTYTRTLEVPAKGNKKGKPIVEKHTIENIHEYEYSVLASLEGTYEAVEVKDAFCTATKYV
ncbi:uncharacterized protein CANTADRAFT_48832 [Suhomyces tanzawaensis NRRL Y-17324]|uniref:Nucleoporin Pom152 n=1 Tax=Suhomyces tanzawaensis NRRL Y-17324 TaxID=984487 RepID=A0A1E4SJG7_9ASCO|nr:uncharacterized protein CANTADRAFT_48832 [Suhomyces tanzawaensis NRRL Y-17324]ODV79649.1 hypothetical protein CANTADRAFT_48832 [Suhomyces tanzawaensis NRRL Y-17324]